MGDTFMLGMIVLKPIQLPNKKGPNRIQLFILCPIWYCCEKERAPTCQFFKLFHQLNGIVTATLTELLQLRIPSTPHEVFR